MHTVSLPFLPWRVVSRHLGLLSWSSGHACPAKSMSANATEKGDKKMAAKIPGHSYCGNIADTAETPRKPTKFSEGRPPIYSEADAFKIGGPSTKSSGILEVIAVAGDMFRNSRQTLAGLPKICAASGAIP